MKDWCMGQAPDASGGSISGKLKDGSAHGW